MSLELILNALRDELHVRHEQTQKSLERIEKALYGNGQPGLLRTVEALETRAEILESWKVGHENVATIVATSVRDVQQKVDSHTSWIEKADKEIGAKREHSRGYIRWVLTWLIALAALAVGVINAVK